MKAFGIALAGVLAMLAWQVARSRPEHRPVAWFIGVGNFLADMIHWTLAERVLAPARATLGAAPYTGVARVAFHVQQGAVLAWPFGLAALACAVWLDPPRGRRAALVVLVLYLAALCGAVAAYPVLRGAALGWAYLVAESAALLTVLAAGRAWWSRTTWPTFTEGSVLVLGAIQIGVISRWSPFGSGWEWQRTLFVVAYAALVVVHMGETWRSSWRPRSSA